MKSKNHCVGWSKVWGVYQSVLGVFYWCTLSSNRPLKKERLFSFSKVYPRTTFLHSFLNLEIADRLLGGFVYMRTHMHTQTNELTIQVRESQAKERLANTKTQQCWLSSIVFKYKLPPSFLNPCTCSLSRNHSCSHHSPSPSPGLSLLTPHPLVLAPLPDPLRSFSCTFRKPAGCALIFYLFHSCFHHTVYIEHHYTLTFFF